MSDPYLYYKSIKDTLVCGHLDFNCLKLKYEVLKLGVWMSDPFLYYKSIKDTHVCGHLDFNCPKLKYGVNHDIVLFILAPGYTVSTWGCVAGPRSAVGNVSGYRCVSDCRSRGREFDPGPVPYFRGD